jgi:hypothetical protein
MHAKKYLVSFIAVVGFFLLSEIAYPAGVVSLPRTGQIACYDGDGAFISCTDTGQDGNIQAGAVWPAPRFIDHEDGTVTDSLTGLIWTKNANPSASGLPMSWQAALDFVKTLATGGHSDWRLPNINELESLVDAEMYSPSLPSNPPFTSVQAYGYWSSTSLTESLDQAWYIDMESGSVVFYPKYYTYYVWPVRSGSSGAIELPQTGQTSCYADNGTEKNCGGTRQDGDILAGAALPSPRFTIEADNKTVTDKLTGLVWTKNANMLPSRDAGWDNDGSIDDGRVTFQHALAYIAKLNSEAYLSYSDWRLPNRKELRSLVNYSLDFQIVPYLDPFTNLCHFYWSSTTKAQGSGISAWAIDTDEGAMVVSLKTNEECIWPVRGGYIDASPLTSTIPSSSSSTSTTTSIEPTTTTTTTSVEITTTTTSAEPTTTTTVSGRPCPAQKMLGEGNPNLKNLRNFRDNRLAQTTIGRRIINIYYNNTDSINAAIERRPALMAFSRWVLETIAPMVGRKD